MTNWRGIVMVGVVLTIIGQIVHTVGATLTMGYYTDPQYFPVWSNLMMPAEGQPPTSFILTSIGFGLIISLIFAWFYSIVQGSIPGNTTFSRGINYGLAVFLVAGVPFLLTLVLLINLPFGIIISWTIESLVIYLIGGVLAARIIT